MLLIIILLIIILYSNFYLEKSYILTCNASKDLRSSAACFPPNWWIIINGIQKILNRFFRYLYQFTWIVTIDPIRMHSPIVASEVVSEIFTFAFHFNLTYDSIGAIAFGQHNGKTERSVINWAIVISMGSSDNSPLQRILYKIDELH